MIEEQQPSNEGTILEYGEYTTSQKAFEIFHRVTGLVNVLAALCIFLETLADHRTGEGTVITRVVFYTSCGLILHSMAFIVGTSAATVDQHNVWLAMGTQTTCQLQGASIEFGSLLHICWDVVLSLVYVLIVRFNWSERSLRKLEMRIAHPIVSILCFSFVIAAVTTKSFNHTLSNCWLLTYPENCGQKGYPECERGDLAFLFILIHHLLFFLALMVSIVSMVILYCSVRKTEQRNLRYATHQVSEDQTSDESAAAVCDPHRHSREVASQGMLYCSTLLITAVPQTVLAIMWGVFGVWNVAVGEIAFFLVGLSAVPYLFAFLRRRSHMRTRYAKLVKELFERILPSTKRRS